MTIAVTEKKLEKACASRLPDEEVLATGMFQPYGSGVMLGEGVGAGEAVAHAAHLNPVVDGVAGLVAGFASERGLATAEHQPPWTVLAVTADKIHAFDASAGGGMAATDKLGNEYATWNRDQVAVHVTKYVASFTLTIEDHEAQKTYQYKGNEIYKVGGKLVAHLLT